MSMSNRKVPLRKCIATQEMKSKRELVRIVRSKEGEVSIDLSGKNQDEVHIYQKIKKALFKPKRKTFWNII